MVRKRQRARKIARKPYKVGVRGEIPADLHQRISELHALAISHRPNEEHVSRGGIPETYQNQKGRRDFEPEVLAPSPEPETPPENQV